LAFNAILVLIVHKVAQSWTKPQYMSWRAALETRGDNINPSDPQMVLALNSPDDHLLFIYIHYLSKLLFSLVLQFSLVGIWLYRISAIYSSR